MSNEKPPMIHGQFCWNELVTNDVEKSKDFYTNFLGWETQDIDMGNGVIYTMLKSGDKELAGMMKSPEGPGGNPMPSHWQSYIYVEDIDAAVEKAKSLGAEIVVPVMQAGEYGRLAIIIDPTGVSVGLWQSA